MEKYYYLKQCWLCHDDVIKWKHFPLSWPFVRGIHRSPVNSQHKDQWRGALMSSLICVWINGWVNNGEAGDLRWHCAHYDVTVMVTDCRADSRLAPSQWEMSLQCNAVSHWRGTYLKSALDCCGSPGLQMVTHYDLLAPYDFIELGHHLLMLYMIYIGRDMMNTAKTDSLS